MKPPIRLALPIFLIAALLWTTHTSSNVVFESNGITCKAFVGSEAAPYWHDIAREHIDEFKKFPYLYQGSYEEEKAFLEHFFTSKKSLHLIVFNKEHEVVGISCSLPLSEEVQEVQEPFIKKGLDVTQYWYISEFIIEPEYRGQGLLRCFVTEHEKHAKAHNAAHMTFITIQRPIDHPLRPRNYRSLDQVWRHFGYEKMQDMHVKWEYLQIDSQKTEETTMDIWSKKIA